MNPPLVLMNMPFLKSNQTISESDYEQENE